MTETFLALRAKKNRLGWGPLRTPFEGPWAEEARYQAEREHLRLGREMAQVWSGLSPDQKDHILYGA